MTRFQLEVDIAADIGAVFDVAAWQPEFVQTALVDPEELLGCEEWKLAKGEFF